jgi:ATP-dependent HslUV protease ATP-binding subunit HslU
VGDLERILTEPKASLTKQYCELMSTEGLTINFTKDGTRRIAEIAFEVNEGTENIGARRLHTILERLLEDISYNASDLGSKDEKISINKAFVEKNLGELASNEDLTRFIL